MISKRVEKLLTQERRKWKNKGRNGNRNRRTKESDALREKGRKSLVERLREKMKIWEKDK